MFNVNLIFKANVTKRPLGYVSGLAISLARSIFLRRKCIV